MAKKLFSIITPTLNPGRKLEDTIKSVLSQNEELFEYIIVDGGSTDETLNIIGQYGEGIKWISEGDRGPYDSMNKGIRMATGDYLYFLGAGDLLRPNILEKLQKYIPNAPLTFIYGNVYVVDTQTAYLGEVDEEKIRHSNICHQASFYERTIFDVKGLFDLKYRMLADWAFNIQCFADERIERIYVAELIADVEGGGISTGRDINCLRDFVPNYDEHLAQEIADAKQHQKHLESEIKLLKKQSARSKQYQNHLEREIKKQKQYQSSLEAEIEKYKQYQTGLESEIEKYKQYQSILGKDIAILKQDLETITKRDKEGREQLRLNSIELGQQAKRESEMRAQISDLEEELSCQAEVIREQRAESSAVQDQLRQSMQILAGEKRRAQSKKELLHCMSNSPVWPMMVQPRRSNLWKQGRRVWQRIAGREVLLGNLDMPMEDCSAAIYLEI